MTIDQMRLWLKEGAAIERGQWKQTVLAMRLAQCDDEQVVKDALRD